MKMNRSSGGWRLLLLVGYLFSAQLGATPPHVEDVAERLRKATDAYNAHCAAQFAVRARVHADQGAEDIVRLRELNDRMEARLAAGTLNQTAIFEEGIAYYSSTPVTDKSNQSMPYRELRMPLAFTGAYVPTAKKGKEIDPTNFDGVIIALPGIGFSVSTAKSLFEITGTFNNGRNPALTIEGDRKLRMISIPLDAPLNGMGEDAPFGMGTADGVMEVVRHGILIFQAFYPGKKIFLIGRSQGGLNVLEAAVRFRDIAGAIALNPSNPDPEIVAECERRHEEMAKPENILDAQSSGFDCNFHELSWEGHRQFTPTYSVLNRASLVPSLHLLGKRDWSYPPKYTDSWNSWIAQDPTNRKVAFFDGGHNLWMRPRGDNEALFEEVVSVMRAFIVENLKKP